MVELTWDVLPEDLDERALGDTEADFGRRALERVRPQLESILRHSDSGETRAMPWEEEEQVERKFAHYHILELPKRCHEPD